MVLDHTHSSLQCGTECTTKWSMEISVQTCVISWVYGVLQDSVALPVKDGRLLLLDVIGGDVSSLVAVVHDTPPVLGVIEQQQPLALPQVQLMTPLGWVVIFGRHPTVLTSGLACCFAHKRERKWQYSICTISVFCSIVSFFASLFTFTISLHYMTVQYVLSMY